MYKNYYKLGADPFRLTPDPAFVSPHQSFCSAQARMLYALEQGDGILIVTGRPGTGKTTLIANFLSRLQPDKVLAATVVGTALEGEGLLRMVGRAFGLNVRNMDKATLLCELQDHLEQRTRALLVIDEAHNLTPQALGEVYLLGNMYTGSRPLLQIFLVGQEQLHESLHVPQMQQLHQRLMAAEALEPLSLQETHNYILYRLHCAGWRGNPAIVNDTFILIHRFSQGLPRYISKLCTRLLEHGARHCRNNLSLDDAVTVIRQMQHEKLLPLHCETQSDNSAQLPLMQDLLDTSALPTTERIPLTVEEHTFLEASPRVVQKTPAALVRAAKQSGQAMMKIDTGPEEILDRQHETDSGPGVADSNGPSPLRIASERYGKLSVQLLKSGAYRLDVLLRPLLYGLRHFGNRSQALKPVAQNLWQTLGHYASTARDILGPTVTRCRETLSGFVSGLSPRQAGAGGVSLLLVIFGLYLFSGTREDQQQQAEATVAEAPIASPEAAPAAVPAITVAPTEEEAGEQVALIEPATAATATAITESPQPDHSPAKVPEVVEQKALADTGEAETDSGESAATARDILVDDLLSLAEQAIARDHLRTPENKNAWHYYSQVLVLVPDNRTAQDGMQRIAARYRVLAASGLRKQEFDMAEKLIQRGLSVSPDDRSLLTLQQEVQTQRRAMYAQQQEQALLAQSESEPVSQVPAADPPPNSGGLFGALKRVFNGNRDTH